MSNNRTRFAREKTALDGNLLKLSAQNPENQKYASLVWSVGKTGKVTATVWTGNEQDSAKITFEPYGFTSLVNLIEQVTTDKIPGFRMIHEDYSYGAGGRRSETQELQGTFLVQREPDGRIFVMVMSPDTRIAKIKFYLSFPRGYQVLDKDKKTLEVKELSNIRAKAYFESVHQIVMHLIPTLYEHPQPKTQSNNNGGRPPASGNKSGGESSGGWDDVPH